MKGDSRDALKPHHVLGERPDRRDCQCPGNVAEVHDAEEDLPCPIGEIALELDLCWVEGAEHVSLDLHEFGEEHPREDWGSGPEQVGRDTHPMRWVRIVLRAEFGVRGEDEYDITFGVKIENGSVTGIRRGRPAQFVSVFRRVLY